MLKTIESHKAHLFAIAGSEFSHAAVHSICMKHNNNLKIENKNYKK